jgi:radical SAM superfamily enzyme YgiQ (UPF0313 family)
MRIAPPLDPDLPSPPPTPRSILLINPFYPKDPHGSFAKHVLTPALALTSIAAATAPEWSVRFWDENLLQGPPPLDPFPQVVGITVHTAFARRAYELADLYRRRGATVALGGLHVTACPNEARAHADAIVTGEGMGVWPQLLADLDAGRLHWIYRGSWQSLYREQPLPRRDVLPSWGFLTNASLIATRGCHNRCDFCFLSTRGVDVPLQVLDRDQVARQIREAGEPYAVFLDNNLGTHRAYLRKLCATLRELDIIWSAAVSLDVTDDPDLVRAMALSGCTGVFIGFESLGDENLRAAGKRSPRAADYAARVRLLHDHGIQINGSFVFGFDGDGPEVFEETVDWIEANRLECATFHILTPYPGTPLFERLKEECRLLHTDWDRYDTAHAVFNPLRMTPKQLEAGYDWAYSRVFSPASIWRRRPAQAAAVPAYLAMSLLYKKMNRLWPFIIRHRLTHALWRPLVELSRRRHLRFRRRLAATAGEPAPEPAEPISLYYKHLSGPHPH